MGVGIKSFFYWRRIRTKSRHKLFFSQKKLFNPISPPSVQEPRRRNYFARKVGKEEVGKEFFAHPPPQIAHPKLAKKSK